MKKLFLFLLLSAFFVSCESESEIRSDIDRLKLQRQSLTQEVNELESVKHRNEITIKQAREELKELNLYQEGETPNYIVKFQLKQSHFSLSVSKHLKDEMNKIEFDLPVSREFYNSVSVGTEVIDEFRSGSFLMEGSFGSWKMKVIEKHIE